MILDILPTTNTHPISKYCPRDYKQYSDCRSISYRRQMILRCLLTTIETFKIFLSKQLWYKLNLFYFKFCLVVGTHILLITYISKRISIPITKPNLKQNRYSMYHNCFDMKILKVSILCCNDISMMWVWKLPLQNFKNVNWFFKSPVFVWSDK